MDMIPTAAPRKIFAPVPGSRVLVVDDEAGIREALGEMLELAGYSVELADGSLDAWERLRAKDYDAVLSDMRMPRMSGMELYGLLKSLKPGLARRFIAVTGDDLGGSLQSFLADTGVPCIGKPFAPREVLAAVAAIILANDGRNSAAAGAA
jgi:CheY-like chemotaxis protein